MITGNKGLVTKTLFPSEVLPVIALISNSLSHLVGLLIIFIVIVSTGGTVGPYVLMVPVYFFFMCVMILGLSWIFSSLNVFVRDAGQVLTIAMTLWFYYTPIFWPLSIMPEDMRIVIYANPFYHVTEGYRMCLMVGEMPPLGGLLYLACFSLVVFGFGGMLFKRLKPAFADVL
jgi:ABC-type polysaccharide/polyol phosphate export permease